MSFCKCPAAAEDALDAHSAPGRHWLVRLVTVGALPLRESSENPLRVMTQSVVGADAAAGSANAPATG